MKRTTYQHGSVMRKHRALGPDVWVLRYMDGDVQRAKRIGTVDKYPTKAHARKKAVKMLEEINERLACIRVSGLCDRFATDAMPARLSTASAYKSYLKRFRERWSEHRVDDMARDVMAMEQWINGYQTLGTKERMVKGVLVAGRPPRDASKKTKQHLKAFTHRVLELAIKWGYLTMQRNPVTLVEVKGNSKRIRKQNIISVDQYNRMLANPDVAAHVRVMMAVGMLLGLRVSEMLGLRWEDVDLQKGTVVISRSCVGGVIDETKSEESAQELPIHAELVAILTLWRKEKAPVSGWVFGNPMTENPYWADSLQADHLVPVGRKVGIPNLGWHDFRHTYRSAMRQLGVSVEEQRTLMRHTDIRTTMLYGGKTPAEIGRSANTKVVEFFRRSA